MRRLFLSGCRRVEQLFMASQEYDCIYGNAMLQYLTVQVLREWDRLGLTDLIYDMYEIYHVERLQNAFDDIDELVLEKQECLGTA